MSNRTIIVHVNQHVIKHNARYGTSLPTLTVKGLLPDGASTYCHEVEGFGRTVDCHAQGRKPLSCGARVWMEYDPATFRVLGDACDFPTLERDRLAQVQAANRLPSQPSGVGVARDAWALPEQAPAADAWARDARA